MGFTEINNGGSATRLADLNADDLSGNVLIIAAKESSSNDRFKIEHLTVEAKVANCDGDNSCDDAIVVEAEDMVRWNYRLEDNGNASGDQVVKLDGNVGSVTTQFEGAEGDYNLKVNYIDEDDGCSSLVVYVNGTEVETILLHDQVGDHRNGFASATLADLHLETGDEIEIVGYKDANEYARIDSLVFEHTDCDTTPGPDMTKASIGDRVWFDKDADGYQDWNESGLSNVNIDLYGWDGSSANWLATTTSNSQGDYSFHNLEEGWYYIQADKNSLIADYAFTGKNSANDNYDSDVNDVGTGSWTWLDEGEVDNSWDVGVYDCPIILDLTGDGVHTLSFSEGVSFDMNNDGIKEGTGWISGADAFVVYDANGNGTIDDRSEMFGGDNLGDGFRKLAGFDTNTDGIINTSDEAFSQLQIWQDANENGVTDEGELGSLADFGISSLGTQFESRVEGIETYDNGNRLLDWATAEKADGSTVDLIDVYFAKTEDIIELSGVADLAPDLYIV